MKSRFGASSKFTLVCFLLFFCGCWSVFAQDLDEVTIIGNITDSNGAALPGATVTAILTAKSYERVVTSDAQGRYRLIELPPGIYLLRVTAKNFAAAERKDLNTISGQQLRLDFKLMPGAIVVETVVVDQGSVPVVDTTRTIVGGTITQNEIEELPNLNRNPFDLIFTLGAVTEEPFSTRDLAEDKGLRRQQAPDPTAPEAGIFALAGGAAYSNNITIDGLDNNDDRDATFRFQPSVETVAEVQVVANQFSAEYGRASGGRVNLRTKNGDQNFRGRLYYYFRDESLNANTNRNKSRGVARPAFQDNNPGFTFGGPVPLGYFKNKTFFFAGYEYQNIGENTIIDTLVPTIENPRFSLPPSTSPGQIFDDRNGAIAPYLESVSTPLRNHILTVRVDHVFTPSHNITINYQRGVKNDFRQFSGGSRLAEALVGARRNTDAINLTHNFIVTPNVVNQFRFQFSQLTPATIADADLTSPVVVIDLPSELNRGGTLTAGSSTSNSSRRRELRTQFQNTLTAVLGAHTWRFGADLQRVNSDFTDRADATGTFRFNSVNAFIASEVSRLTQIFGNSSTQRNTYASFFVQDDWRIRDNLTVTAGGRYEQETIVADKNNFSPRVAVAYDPFKSGRGVIRFGLGIFYNRALLKTIDDFSLGKSQIEFDTNNIPSAGRAAVLQTLSNQFPQSLTINNPLVEQYKRINTDFSRRLAADLEIPESYQGNVGFEREILGGVVFEANLTVNKTVKLWRDVNANAISLVKLNELTGGNYKNLTEYLLSRDFVNLPGTGGTRPFFGGASSSAANYIRFIQVPFNPNAQGAQSSLGSSNNPNPDLGGIICINGAASCSNSTRAPNPNRYYLINLNSLTTTNNAAPITAALAVLNRFRPDPSRAQIEQLSSLGNSFYRGLTLELRKRFAPLGFGFGATLRAAYTFSSLKDDGVVNTSSAQTQNDFDAEFTRSLLDRRHRLVFSGTLETPFWLGNISLSPVVRLASGAPFNLSAGGIDRNLDDVINDRPNFSGNLSDIRWRDAQSFFPINVFNSLTLPVIGESGGNLPRNAGSGPGQFIFDLNLSRRFKFSERVSLCPKIEVSNVFNSTVFAFGTGFVNANDLQSTFLVPQRTLRPRLMRIGIRFDF